MVLKYMQYLKENFEEPEFFKVGEKVIVNGNVDGQEFINEEGFVLEFSHQTWKNKKLGLLRHGLEYHIIFKNNLTWWVSHENLSKPEDDIKEEDIEWF